MLCINIAQQIFHFLIYTDNVSGKIIYGAIGRKVISLYLNLQKEYMYIYIVVYTVIEKNGLLTSISKNKQVFPPFFYFLAVKQYCLIGQKYKTCLVSTYDCLSQWEAFVFY